MSVSPSKDLSRHFGHAAILQTVGIDVKDCLPPKLVKCPICSKDTLGVYSDPFSVTSQWLTCSNCGYRGDTIELFSRIKGIEKLEDTITRAVGDGLADGPIDSSPESVNSYIINYPMKRAGNARIWTQMQDLLSHDQHPDMVYRLQTDHLWGGGRAASRNFLKFIGGGIKRDIDGLFSKPILPKTFKNVIALNFQDIPGRSCALQFISETGEKFLKFLAEPSNNKHEGGLAMLENINPHEGTVFAIGDSYFGMQLQRLWLNTTSIPAKIVIYNDNTFLAWSAVDAQQLILWAPELTWRIFDHARVARNALIAVKPDPRTRAEVPYKYLTDTTAPGVLDILSKSAEKWEKVFCDWVLDENTPNSVSRDAVNQLAFSTQQRNDIMSACPPGRRAQMEVLFSGLRAQQKAMFNRQTIEERNNGWHIVYAANSSEVICTAVIRVHEEHCERKTGKIYWKGAIVFKGQTLEFNDNLELIEKDTEAWLRKKTVAAGLGTPEIRPNWRKYLVSIARTFSNAKAVVTEMKLGLQGNGDFIMPRFKLSGGVGSPEPFRIQPEGTPSTDLGVPDTSVSMRSPTVTPARAAYAVIASTFVMNQIRRMKGLGPRPTAVIGASGSVARCAMRHFSETLGMRSFAVVHPNDILDVHEKARQFDFPTFVEPSDNGRLVNFTPTISEDIMVGCAEAEAYAMAIGGGWTIINAPGLRDDKYSLPPISDVMNYITNLQNRNFVLETEETLAHGVLEDFCKWFSKSTGMNYEKLFTEAKHMFYTPSSGEALVDLYANLVLNQKAGLSHSKFTARMYGDEEVKHAVTMDDHENKVLLARAPLITALGMSKLPRADLAMPTADLAKQDLLRPCGDGNKGWLIEKEYWDSRCQMMRWRSLPADI